MVTRRDLRAERDFYSPMTGDKSSTYGSQVRSRLEDLKNVKGTRAPAIEAAFVKLLKTEDPFTQIDEKKSYAPDEEDGLMGSLEGLGDGGGGGSDVVERVEEFLEPLTGGSGGGGNRPNVISRNPNDRISSMSTQQLVDRDNRRYGNTFPDGSFNITKKPDGDPGTTPKTEETRTYYGQGGLPLGTTTIRQGGEVKDGKYVGPQEKGPAINASGFQQANVRGSGNPNNTGKDESQRPKQTVASLPSNYKSTEAAAFAKAKSYQDSKAKGQAAAKATNTPSKPPAGSFGISAAGKAQAAANKAAAAKKKSEASKPSAPKPSAPKPSISKSGSRGQGASKKSGSKKSGGKKGGGGGSGGGGGGGSSGGGSKSGGSKSGGTKGGAGRTASSASRRRTGRRRSQCDITTKVDITVLSNLNLIKDDLAEVAYFVRELQEE